MVYEPKNFDHLLGTHGFSDQLLKNHFTLYQGYVTNTNKILERLKTVEQGAPEFAELKRRFGWEFDGMRLHELYFGNMIKGGKAPKTTFDIMKQIKKDFNSLETWIKDFKSTGSMRGIGWAVLAHDKETNKLFNTWINEHDVGHLTGTKPILIMDVFEHAFMIDYGLKRADYIESFFKAIDWTIVEKRFK